MIGHKFVADDLVLATKSTDDVVIISTVESRLPFIYLRDLGFMDLQQLYGVDKIKSRCKLDLIIKLIANTKEDDIIDDEISLSNNLTSETMQRLSIADILGVPIAKLELSNIAQRVSPLYLLVETIVKYYKACRLGYDSHKEFLHQHATLLNDRT